MQDNVIWTLFLSSTHAHRRWNQTTFVHVKVEPSNASTKEAKMSHAGFGRNVPEGLILTLGIKS